MNDTEKMIEVEEGIEGEHVESTNYIFKRIGQPLPIKSHESSFDPQGSPSRPLAVSEKHGLVFVAHPSGFCVVRTKDVMASSEEIEKGSSSSIQELSIVDVPLPNLDILALSTDNSTLAATADADVHFFSVDSLLHQGIKSSSSCSLNESSSIKDLQWTRKPENLYVLLSSVGNLYHGTVGGPMKEMIDNVDAVGWSLKGKLIAVARRDILSILSSNFKERSSMLLSFKSWAGDFDANSIIKVDSIRWVRHDSIILGCFQPTADGNEENYLVQVIKIKYGKFTDGSYQPVVIPFYDLFSGLTDDILPSASGPYLLLSYLEQYELAIIANRKNVDQHIVYLSWSGGNEKNDVVAVDILRDSFLPRIELQENGDDNLILGICIDKVSTNLNISVRLGEEERELSPYCILMCLTLEGKLIMFHVASTSGITGSHVVVSALSDDSGEEEDSAPPVPLESESPKPSCRLEKEQAEKVPVDFPLGIENIKELHRKVSLDVCIKDELKSLDETLMPALVSEQQEVIVPNLDPDKNGKQMQLLGQQNINIEQASTKAFPQGGLSPVFRDFSKTDTHKIVGLGSSSGSLVSNITNAAVKSSFEDIHNFFETGMGSLGKVESRSLQSVSSPLWSSGKILSPKDTDVKSPLIPSTFVEGSRPRNGSQIGVATDAFGKPFGKPYHSKDMSDTSTSVNFSNKPVENEGRRPSAVARNIVSVPSIASSQVSSQEGFSLGLSPNNKVHSSKENYSGLPQSRMPNSELNFSKQFGNIKEMTKELDMLLQSIEEEGGFRNACTVDQKGSVEELENGIGYLSDRCQKWKSIMDERLEEVQHLLDVTVQVLARKIYMEGIVKQASDSQYWDFRNCQKLSSELELKQRLIFKINQDLTDQLIQLERHLNGLELNKFGENDGVHADQSALQSRSGPSRHMQSLHSLHSTMTSQLAAADKLSEYLSKQMAALKIESSSVKKHNIKKELFKTVGIAYDASFSSPSPDATKVDCTPNEKLSFSLGFAASKDQPRRNTNSVKNYELETARRRRDSLDRSWENHEPPKATVKRLLLQESGRESKNRSSPRLLVRSSVTRPRDHTSPVTSLHPSEIKGVQDPLMKQVFESSETPFVIGQLQTSGLKSPTVQEQKFSSASKLSSAAKKIFMREPHLTAEQLGDGTYVENDAVSVKEKSVFSTDTSQKPSISLNPTQTPSFLKKPNDMLNSFAKDSFPTKEIVKDRPFNTTVASIEAGKKQDFSLSPSFSVPVAPSQSGKVAQFDSATSKSQPGNISPSPTFSLSVSAPSSPISSSSSSSPLPLSIPPSVSPSFSFNKPLASINLSTSSSSSSFTSSVVSPSSSFSFDASKSLVPSSAPSPDTSLTSVSLKSEIQHSSKTDVNAKTTSSSRESGPFAAETNLKLKPSVSSPFTIESSTGLASGNQPSFSNASPAPVLASGSQPSLSKASPAPVLTSGTQPSLSKTGPASVLASGTQPSLGNASSASGVSGSNNTTHPTNNVTMNAKQEQQSAGHSPFPIPLSTSGSVTAGRTDGLDVQNAQEDDMDEETPDTSSITELGLGSLAGFGLISAPNPTTTKPNPFGGSFANAATNASSPFSMTAPSGELFRPASLNFQSQQPAQPSQPVNSDMFSGGFGIGTTAQASSPSGFGQPAHVGPGQQALGSVLGAFGQSRQLGAGLQGGSFGSPSGFGGGVAPTNLTGGFSSAATGGFAGAASSGGGFASLASGGGGFGAAASGGGSGGGFGGAVPGGGSFGGAAPGGGGFGGAVPGVDGFGGAAGGGGVFGGISGGGGFAGAVSAGSGFSGIASSGLPAAGGRFGSFGGQQGSGGFSAFGSSGAAEKPPELFTQMRK